MMPYPLPTKGEDVLRKLIVLSAVLLCTTSTSQAREESYRTQAKRIIYQVFPASTAWKAFSVADCETVHFTDFQSSNPTYKARGMFQEIIQNHNRVLFWKDHGSLKINYYHISSEQPDWYSAEVALYQSKGGTVWTEWDCG